MSLVVERMVVAACEPVESGAPLVSLSEIRPGFRGRIARIEIPEQGSFGVPTDELERRLLEIGFTEGSNIEVLHEGLFGRDPIVVLVDGTRIALRRREAAVIFVANADSADSIDLQ